MQVNELAKWIDELQGTMSVIKQQLATLSGSVADVPDFKITTPTSGQILSYDGEHDEFVNSDLPDIPEFDITSPEAGPVMIYDDTEDVWKNGTLIVNNYSKTLLYNTPITSAGQVELADPVTDFDVIEFIYEATSASSGACASLFVDADLIESCSYTTQSSGKHVYMYVSGSEHARITMGEATNGLNIFDNSSMKITSIYGIKY